MKRRNEKKIVKERLLTSLIAAFALTGLQAQTANSVPRLVVGLTIDQLRLDYIEAFESLYGEDGFKRLFREGRVYTNTDYGFSGVDRASALASLYTGTSSGINGIIGADWVDRGTMRVLNCVEDRSFMGIYTDETTSAVSLLTSTLSDELKVATQGKAWMYAIAPYRDAAVLAAGHAGDGAFWINDESGKWCGTTYYPEFPYWVTRFNDQKGTDKRISDCTWEPLFPVEKYSFLKSEWGQDGFYYRFADERTNKCRKFKTCPYVNDEVNKLAEECLYNAPMGQDDVPDLLALTYYAGNYDHKTVLEAPVEMQDMYVRLDKSIADLLDLLDKKVGLSNTLVFIASTGYVDAEASDLKKYRIPTGEFYPHRCAALLNMYLNAIYGAGQFVEAYHGSQIYLDHQLIENKQLDLREVVSKSADFLIQFSGVNEVYTAYRLLLGAWTPEVYRVRNAFNRKRSGDLLIDVLPGWKIVHENSSKEQVVRKGFVPAPLFFVGIGIRPQIVDTPVDMRCVAPSVAHVMRIRAPNASTWIPLDLK